MNCANCGAAMQLVDGGHFWCQYCRTFAFPEAAPGDTPDGLQLTSGSDPRPCPICDQQLSFGVLDGLPAAACATCRGFLMTFDNFAKLVRARRAHGREGHAPPSALDPAALRRRVACPACRAAMEAHPYGGPGPVVVDSCARCRLIWLDAGEIGIIERAPGRR
jgi:Zn-finger nucleic acid-binding protein